MIKLKMDKIQETGIKINDQWIILKSISLKKEKKKKKFIKIHEKYCIKNNSNSTCLAFMAKLDKF